METDLSTIQIIIQAGAVGISLVLIWVIYKLVSNHDTHLLDALNRNTEAWVKNSEALTRLADKLDNLK